MFLASPEAVEVHDVQRAYDIVSGLPWPTAIGERVRRNRFTDEWAEREATLRERKEEFAPPEDVNPFEAPPDPDTNLGSRPRSLLG
ncbi:MULTISPECIES: hypothetical protein [Streptomyces violaceusniger group]|uniref:Uncharacterized protein n=2 Tax=Streptomyces rhizosphaericus TaxID=114699 RepID=A0ABN1QHW6_9ACTN|nr:MULTISPECIES: hypothetical protein [Streptomyces violaceusniger group]